MVKVIHKEIFIALKNRFYYIVGLFALGIAVFSLYGVYHTLSIGDAATEYAIFQMVNENNNCFLDYAAEVLSGNFLSLFVAISVPTVICESFANGYIKNVYNCKIQKNYYAVGKVVVILCIVMFYTLLTLLATCISGLFWFDFEGVGNVAQYIKFASLQILCNTSFGCVIMFVSELFRKLSLSMISGILYVVMLCDLLYQFMNSLISNVGIENFEVEKYTIIGNMTNLTMDSNGDDIFYTIVVAVVYMVIFASLSQLMFLKRDVNCNEK